ncbi:unnamed protein product [Protopolystoma xenopodis]|uniref:Uncharacterized protein n=1 Tax=Protopolystoma xenopodis TaxID=117903 RepID=A0A3S5CH43_9PLAT|nr:unnamed protein product [Protopolystoma xenopodis]
MLNPLEEYPKIQKRIYPFEDAHRVFEHTKSNFAKSTVLAHPDSDADLHFVIKASDRPWVVHSNRLLTELLSLLISTL